MDVVYRYQFDRGDELRYSLRSLRNVPHDRVWIVGDNPPSWVNTRKVDVVPRGAQVGRKWSQSRHNVVAACKHPGISEDFIMMDDDFFVMRPVREIDTAHRGTVSEYLANRSRAGAYMAGFIETVEILRYSFLAIEMAAYNVPIYAYNLHIPMVLNKKKTLDCLDYVWSLKPRTVPQCFHFRTWYGNFWQIGGHKMDDVKIIDDNPVPPGVRYLSTNNRTFANRNNPVAAHIRSVFPEPSPYERKV